MGSREALLTVGSPSPTRTSLHDCSYFAGLAIYLGKDTVVTMHLRLDSSR